MSSKEFVGKDQGLELARGIVKRQLRRAGLKSARQLPTSTDRLKAVHDALADALGAKTSGVSARLITKLTGG